MPKQAALRKLPFKCHFCFPSWILLLVLKQNKTKNPGLLFKKMEKGLQIGIYLMFWIIQEG